MYQIVVLTLSVYGIFNVARTRLPPVKVTPQTDKTTFYRLNKSRDRIISKRETNTQTPTDSGQAMELSSSWEEVESFDSPEFDFMQTHNTKKYTIDQRTVTSKSDILLHATTTTTTAVSMTSSIAESATLLQANASVGHVGQFCLTVEQHRSAIVMIKNASAGGITYKLEPNAFIECAPANALPLKLIPLRSETQLGIWTVRRCAKHLRFHVLRQMCVARDFRENEAPCTQNIALMRSGNANTAIGNLESADLEFCYKYCPVNHEPSADQICNWLGALLYPDPSNQTHFLQCKSNALGDPCGKWIRYSCPPKTVFNSTVQLCVLESNSIVIESTSMLRGAQASPIKHVGSDEMSSLCMVGFVGITKCSHDNKCDDLCPGQTICHKGTCCMKIMPEIAINIPMIIFNRIPLCYGGETFPITPCGSGCSDGYACQAHIGCCPASNSRSARDSDLQRNVNDSIDGITSCSKPVGRCGMCPPAHHCISSLNICCTSEADTTTTQSPHVETTSQAQAMADAYPPMNSNSIDSSSTDSTEMSQPNMALPQTGFVTSSKYLRNGRLPTCSNGLPSVMACKTNLACSPGFECSSGGCCPIPFCPSGIQAIGRCHSNSARCEAGTACLDGLCCPLPVCPHNGRMARAACSTNTINSCGLGYECYNGGCCPLPLCPGGELAHESCAAFAPHCSRADSVCENGVCCALPRCFNTFSTVNESNPPLDFAAAPPNAVAVSFCTTTNAFLFQTDDFDGNYGSSNLPLLAAICPPGYQCTPTGGCCPLPFCASSGKHAVQACDYIGGASVCPSETTCESGFCCPLPKCSLNGQLPMSICGTGSTCPNGYYCDGSGCCPEPLPVCPNGGRAIQACIRGTECPAGYRCTSMGGCCQLSTPLRQLSCPPNLLPICYCSHSAICPMGSSCHAGICCMRIPSSPSAIEFNSPGTHCESSEQCRGFAHSHASCIDGICVCINGAYSNGVTCMAPNSALLHRARNGCDQFGADCKYVLSATRRIPLLSPVSLQNTDENNNNAIMHDENEASADPDTNTPLWFNVAGMRKCPSIMSLDGDSTCLPNEKCIREKCRKKLSPGESSCSFDEECSSKCSNTYCDKHERPHRCLCAYGSYLLYGRCLTRCPNGFHVSSNEHECLHNDEDEFWRDIQSQTQLQKLLNKDIC